MPLGQELLVALTVLHGGRGLALPKGRIERGEQPVDAAVRETREETGLLGRILGPLEEIRYFYYSREWRSRVSKRVAFFLLAYRSGSPAHHDGEVDGVRLLPLRVAEQRLAYEGERRVLATARGRLAL